MKDPGTPDDRWLVEQVLPHYLRFFILLREFRMTVCASGNPEWHVIPADPLFGGAKK